MDKYCEGLFSKKRIITIKKIFFVFLRNLIGFLWNWFWGTYIFRVWFIVSLTHLDNTHLHGFMIRTVIFIFKSLAFKNEERKKHKANELTLNPVALKGIETTILITKKCRELSRWTHGNNCYPVTIKNHFALDTIK